VEREREREREREAQQPRGREKERERDQATRRRKEGKAEESTMASGWGINGNKGRCYDFWLEFSECMSRCRQPSDCGLLREDYLECLHHSKEVSCRPIRLDP